MSAKQKILVVDSDPHILVQLEKSLEDAGYDTHVTWDGKEALSWIGSEDFAAVIVGEHPQAVRCLEVVKKLRDKGDETTCIVLDGPECPAEREKLHALAVRALISKWNLTDVVKSVRAATRKAHYAA